MGRTLRRAAIGILACIAGTLLFLLWRRDVHADIEVFDVAARARALASASPHEASLGEVYYFGAGGQAHLHVLGKSVVCGLHLHEHTEEATIPVFGRPAVTQRFTVDSSARTRQGVYPEGCLIVSPSNCAHEWRNESSTEDQGNLVLTLGAPFPGNLFVAPDDARIRKGGAPTLFDLHVELARFLATEERARRIELPVAAGAIAAVMVRDDYPVALDSTTVTLIYCAAGRGRVDSPSKRIDLRPGLLIVIHRGAGVRVVADAAEPLAAYVIALPLAAKQSNREDGDVLLQKNTDG